MENRNVVIGSIVVVVLIIAGVLFFMNQNQEDTTQTNTQPQTTETTEAVQNPDIVATASQTESLSTLVSAVQAADLVSTLQGEGPFTVLAPTNDAFAALPEGTLDSLLLPENKDTLAGILTYHVISGEVMSMDLTDAQGGSATVTTADVKARNGVVHIIDAVLMPAS